MAKARSASLADDTYAACLEISAFLEKVEKRRISIDTVVRFLIVTSELTEVRELTSRKQLKWAGNATPS